MMTHTQYRPTPSGTPIIRTVALVGRYAHRHLHDVHATVDTCEVVFIESITHAYSKIKRVRPDLIVLCLSDDDVEGCRVLSMLALDGETARIPVLTHVTPELANAAAVEADAAENAFRALCSMPLN